MSITSISGESSSLPEVLFWHRYKQQIRQWNPTPGQIAIIYAGFGVLALYLSDFVFPTLFRETEYLRSIQTVKGGIEVLLTAGLIFVLTRRSRRKLGQTNNELKQKQEQLDVLNRVLRHNIRNDMNIIQGHGSRLSNEPEEVDVKQSGAAIRKVSEKIIEYSDNAQLIYRAGQNNMRTSMDLVAIVERVTSNHPELLEQVMVDVELPDTAPVYANRMLSLAIKEVITNAVIHNDAHDPSIKITVDPEDGPGHQTTLAVVDNGPGFPNHVMQAIQQRTESNLVHLEGLGLWFAFWTSTNPVGEFRIRNHESGGGCVQIRLPTV